MVVVVEVFGGNTDCRVRNVQFTFIPSSAPWAAQVVEVGAIPSLQTSGLREVLSRSGTYTIQAVGKCSDGRSTPGSNVVEVNSVPPAPIISQANFFGSNFGNRNTGSNVDKIFTKFPIVDGTYVSVDTPAAEAKGQVVSLSGYVGAKLVPPVDRRRSLMSTGQIQICEDMSQTPEFNVSIDSTGLDVVDISLSGLALAGVDKNGSLYYTPEYNSKDIARGDFDLVVEGNFSKVALNDPAVLLYDDQDFALYYNSDIDDIDEDFNVVDGTGMNLSSSDVFISLSGVGAAVTDSNRTLYYAADITAPVWTQIPFPPSITELNEVGLAGKQVVVTDSKITPSANNVWYAKDITNVVDENSWTNIGGAMRSVSLSLPPSP